MLLRRIFQLLKRQFRAGTNSTLFSEEHDSIRNNSCVSHQFSCDIANDTPPKRMRLPEGNSDINLEYLLPLKKLLTCSVCLEPARQACQCSNGHLICLRCARRLEQVCLSVQRGGIACVCPTCRESLKVRANGRGLQRSLVAEQLALELPASCRYCKKLFLLKHLESHQQLECEERLVSCKNSLFGCKWTGVYKDANQHVSSCPVFEQSNRALVAQAQSLLEDVFKNSSDRLSPWRGLLNILEEREQDRFGKRYNTGYRVITQNIDLDRNHSDTENISFISKPVRIPLVGKNSLWINMRINVSPKEITPGISPTISYAFFIRKSEKLSTSETPLLEPIYYSIANLKCLSEPEETVSIIDTWHRYIAKPILNPNYEDATKHYIRFSATSLQNSRLSQTISEERLRSDSSFQALIVFAVDPKLFLKKDEASNPSQEENTEEPEVISSSSESSSDSEDENDDGDDNDVLYSLAIEILENSPEVNPNGVTSTAYTADLVEPSTNQEVEDTSP